MARTSGPVTVVESAKARARALQRVPFESKGIFDEHWIQDLVANHPDIIGIESLETLFAPAVTVGYELESGAGSIDVLLANPRGLITLVETKLWRNAEARRTVVAQILDYARELRHWSYDELDSQCRRSMDRKFGISKSLWEWVSEHPSTDGMTSEVEFIDNVERCLKSGHFLLLIVGDGVKEGVEELVSTIQGAPGLEYTMRLVELRCFHVDPDSNWPLIVVPSVIAKTAELVRAVVRVETRSEPGISTNVQVEVDTLDIESRLPAEETIGSASKTPWDERSFFANISDRCSNAESETARLVYRWAQDNMLRCDWTGGPSEAACRVFHTTGETDTEILSMSSCSATRIFHFANSKKQYHSQMNVSDVI